MSFIASLATVGTAVGVTGAIAAPLAGAGLLAAGGAGLGAGMSAAMGGDPGEGAMMGAITAPLMAPLMPAAGAAAPATQVGSQAAAQAGTQAALQGAGSGLTSYGLGQAATPFTGEVIGGSLANVAGGVSQTAVPFLDTLAGKALTGAGTGALIGGVTNPDDPLKGAAIGAGAGALGGYGSGALAGSAGTGGAMGAIGDFALAHPVITSGLISAPTSMMMDAALTPDPTIPEREKLKSRFSYNKQFNYAPGYATGGITDLDTYMSNAQNIPNPREVADPEGYGANSVQMLAGGGISKLIPGGSDVADSLVSSSLPGMIFGWDSASEIPLIGGLFSKPEDIATLTSEEKKKLMGMAAQQGQVPQQMAEGGIADLGGYAAGGIPNLLQGAGDGVSDDIPATIAGKQPARLAAGEYVIPSRIVSELGQGSTDAGAKRLDEMVKKIQAGRKKSMGSKKQFANDTKAYRHLPA